jgi:hypothetical protein
MRARRPEARFAGSPSGLRKKGIDELIVFASEWIDERDILQREPVLKIFGQHMPDAGTLGRGP